jgi:hypothetical protein
MEHIGVSEATAIDPIATLTSQPNFIKVGVAKIDLRP